MYLNVPIYFNDSIQNGTNHSRLLKDIDIKLYGLLQSDSTLLRKFL